MNLRVLRSMRRMALAALWMASSALVPLVAPAMAAASYPAKPIHIVVPFGAGGIADLTARTVAQKMSETLGQAIVVENRPGAGGVVATQAVARAQPDGYTLLLMSNGNAVSVGLFKSLPFDTVKDLVPVSTLGYFDLAVIARSDSKFRDLRDLVSYARGNPGKVNIGTINVGSTQNLAGELLRIRSGIDAQIVPFGGTPALVSAVLGGSVDAAIEIVGPVMSQISAGKLRALAVMGAKRRQEMPDVPTVIESGIPDFEVASWNALAVPAGTPKEIVERLNREINAAVAAPEVRSRLSKMGVDARGGTPEEARALLESEIRRWSDVIEKAGIPRQ
ncbi:MAG TPA: tripartite tricarboxylate transporter substrate binding protein [Usitatibacter sp.]|nr:tripartite tricarboxylate transporter substrate binding protein [Usitatibacter sp.]